MTVEELRQKLSAGFEGSKIEITGDGKVKVS